MRERNVIGYLNEDGTATVTGSGLPVDEAAAACAHVEELARATDLPEPRPRPRDPDYPPFATPDDDTPIMERLPPQLPPPVEPPDPDQPPPF